MQGFGGRNSDTLDARSSQNLIDGVNAAILIIDDRRRLLKRNALAARYFGESGVGKNLVGLIRNPRVLSAVEEVAKTGHKTQLEVDLPVPAVTPFLCRILSLDGNRNRIMLVFEDLSEQIEAQQMRSEFVANVSHELRSPLTALSGFIETLQTTARDDPSARENFLGLMESETERMGRLIKDLLSLSQLQASGPIFDPRAVKLSEVIDHVFQLLTPMSLSREVDLRLLEAPKNLMVEGDQDQLIQVFQNLLENAIKYGGAGKPVEVQISRANHHAKIAIRDQGEGIDAADIPRLTERFYRVDKGRAREMGGTGLGLAIVKHILNRHRGELEIISAPKKGATFTVRLPITDSN